MSTLTLQDHIRVKIKELLKIELDKLDDSFQKKTEISTITNDQVKTVEQLLNDRQVRKFNYKTPNQVLLEKIALIT
jgi:hypothetical protein